VTVIHVNMVVIVIHMVIIPTVVLAQSTNGMVATASLLTIYPPVLVLHVPIMGPATPTVPTTSTVIVNLVLPGNSANMS